MITKWGGSRWLPVSLLVLAIGCGGEEEGAIKTQSSTTATMKYVVYIRGMEGIAGCRVFDEGDQQIQKIYVFPGEIIRWINTLPTGTKVIGASGLFEQLEYSVGPNSYVETPVLATAAPGEYDVGLPCWEGTVTGPKVVVGDPP